MADASGNGNTGTITAATWTTAGKFGKALSFNGTSARVTIADAPSLDLTNAFTLEGWAFPIVTQVGWRTLVAKDVNQYYLMTSSSGTRTPAVGGTYTGGQQLYAPNPLPVNTWTHRAATYDRVTLRLYVNGVQVASRALTTVVATSTAALNVGANSYGEYFNGVIDEVRVYNRALTANEIQTDMATPVTTSGGNQAPTATITSPATNVAINPGASVAFAGSGTDPDGSITGYSWSFPGGTPNSSSSASPGNVAYSTAGNYTASLTVTDNGGLQSPPVTRTITVAAAADTAPPTAPSNLTAAANGTQITLTWTAATDNVGVTGYRVERCQGSGCSNFAQIAPVTGLSYVNSGLAPTTSYTYRVRATDAAGNAGPYSNPATATTGTGGTPTGLVAAYGFDEGAGGAVADASGNGNTGTITAATWTTAGKFGKALSFNGTSARVTVAAAPSLDLTNAFTLEGWAFPIVTQVGWRTLVARDVNRYYLMTSSSGTRTPAVGGTYTGGQQLYAPNPLPVNTWTHLAATYDRVTLRLYVNGVQVASRALTTVVATSTAALNVGANSYGEYFNGVIDEVRVYNRALTASEIQTDMATPLTP